MSRYIDAERIEPFIKREEWDTPDERWRPESEFGQYIDAIPTADVAEVRHGRWIWKGEEGDSRFMCSVCHCKEDVPTCNGEPTIWDYCPNCGSRMDLEGEDD